MPEADPNVNWIRHRVRRELDADTVEVRQSLDTPLQIRRRLAEGRAVAMLMDRHVERDRVPVTMFGRQAHFMGAPALLAYLTGAPLVPIFLVREGRGRFRARPQDPILLDRTADRDQQVRRATQRVATLLEREIAARPECWYQFYRYWEEPAPGQPHAAPDATPGPAIPAGNPPPARDAQRGSPHADEAAPRTAGADSDRSVPEAHVSDADSRIPPAVPGARGGGRWPTADEDPR